MLNPNLRDMLSSLHKASVKCLGGAAIVVAVATAAIANEPLQVSVDLDSKNAKNAWRFVSGQWQIADGVIEQLDERKVGATALLKAPICDNCRYDVQFLPKPGSGVRAAGLAFRVQDDATFYYVHLDALSDKIMLVISTPQQMWNEIVRVTNANIHLDKWNTARVINEGPRIRVYLNGKLVIDKLDDTFVGGGFGLRTSQGHVLFKEIKIEGRTVELADARRYVKPPFVVVCEDAGAGADEEFPDVARLSNGELICVFYAGYAHGSKPSANLPNGGRIAFVKSYDNGKTWSNARTLFDSPLDDRDPSICEIAPGKLLCNFFTYHYPNPSKGILATAEIRVIRSDDFGETWERHPVTVKSPFDGSGSTSAPICKLTDGTLVMPVYGYRRDRPYHYIPAVIRSRDQGRTWGDTNEMVANYPDSLPEPALCLLPDGRVICHMRPIMVQCYSDDGGRTWSQPRRLPFQGDAPSLLATSQGVLLSAFRQSGTRIALSRDWGTTWHGPQRLDVCNGAYPSMVEMPDGTILFTYYTGGSKSDIRALRIRPTGQRVEVLPYWK